jgi:hypothetical protein
MRSESVIFQRGTLATIKLTHYQSEKADRRARESRWCAWDLRAVMPGSIPGIARLASAACLQHVCKSIAADSEERVNAGFMALLQRLEGDSLVDPLSVIGMLIPAASNEDEKINVPTRFADTASR